NGEVHGMFANGELCGVCGFIPSLYGENLGADIGFSDSECANCVTLECYFVAPAYRSNGIARELAHVCVGRAVEAFGCTRVLATVSPKNIGSLMSMMSINGFQIKAMRQKYGCKLRYIMCYTHSSTRLYTYYERFSVFDVYAISRCLAKGYEGISLFKNEDGIFVWLAK
ncbi:MAG: GNAT family N-acetyltransferase, partial [Oscillospiraceae bacterium]